MRSKTTSPGSPRHRALKRVSRLKRKFYMVRYMADADEHRLEQRRFRCPVANDLRDAVYNALIETPHRWHVLTITYCRDGFGKEYRLLGYGRSIEQLVIEGAGFSPFILGTCQEAEHNCNERHIYARGLVLAPYSKDEPSLVVPAQRARSVLQLTEDDVAALKELERGEDLKGSQYYFDRDAPMDIDGQIGALLG